MQRDRVFRGFSLGDGTVTTDLADVFDVAWAVAVQRDGRIVAAGTSAGAEASLFALARYLPDGRLDPSFGGDGTVTTGFATGSRENNAASAMALQADGRIVVAGLASNDFALARYLPDGRLDATFGGDGTVTTDLFGGFDQAHAVALQPGGGMVAVGTTVATASPPGDFAVVRYRPDGTLDPRFGTGGKIATDFGAGGLGGNDEAHAVQLQRDGRIVVAGIARDGDFALARYRPDGTLDPAFGAGGTVTTDFGGSFDRALALALQPGGRAVAAGRAHVAGIDQFALARYRLGLDRGDRAQR